MTTESKPAMRSVSLILVSLSVLCFIPDPYSYGGIGGDRNNFEVHLWQPVLTAGLITISLIGLLQKERHYAMRFFAAEALVFAVLNVVYITRDGADIRLTLGNVGSRLPVLLLAIGVILRIAHIVLLVAKVRRAKAV